MFSSKRDYFEWTIQQLLKDTQRRFPSTYIENTFQGYPEYFQIFRNALQSALQNLNLFSLACVAGEERGGVGRKARKRGKGKGAPYQLSSSPFLFSIPPYPLPFSTPATQASSVILGQLISLFEITRASVLFFRQFQVRFKVLRK